MAKGMTLRCHMPAASLGHYASLSFVVIGSVQRAADRSQRREEKDFSVGAAFGRDLTISTTLTTITHNLLPRGNDMEVH